MRPPVTRRHSRPWLCCSSLRSPGSRRCERRNSGTEPELPAGEPCRSSGRRRLLSAALVDDFLRAAVAGADDLAFGLRVFVDDREREVFNAVLLDLVLDLGLQLAAFLPLRLRPRAANRETQHHCRDDHLAHFFPLAAFSQSAPLNLRTFVPLTVPGSRQRTFTLTPSGCDRGT